MFNPATSSVTFAGKDSVPAIAPSAIFLATACSDFVLRFDADHLQGICGC
jgi:hypothetical protein